MSRRSAFAIWALALALLLGFGSVAPAVVAQEATPEAAVAPPQDLQPLETLESNGQTAKINGVDIYYEVYGEGDPVILLHSGLSNGDHFMKVIPALAEDYQIIVMDSRGHGRSSFDDTPIPYDLMSSDVLGLLDHLKIPQTDLVGWSDGGIIGLDIALSNPDRLNRVVAYGANFDPTGVRLDVGSSDRFNAYIARAAQGYQTTSPHPERWDEFLANISNMWATEPNWTMEQIASITTPFLILDGAEEEAIDLNQTKLMAVLMPNAELVIIPSTGHFAMFEKPEEFDQIVLDYLATGTVATPTA